VFTKRQRISINYYILMYLFSDNIETSYMRVFGGSALYILVSTNKKLLWMPECFLCIISILFTKGLLIIHYCSQITLCKVQNGHIFENG